LAFLTRYAQSAESIEFVTEHFPEIAMDNRNASLPLWNTCEDEISDEPRRDDNEDGEEDDEFCIGVDVGYQRTRSGTFSIDGPLLAISAVRPFGEKYHVAAFVFFDDFALKGGSAQRPLDITFANPPLVLPADARYDGLDGDARDVGLGIAINGNAHWRWLPSFQWSVGLMWQRLRLTEYSFAYEVTEGRDAGSTGTLDYSATYSHFSPFVGAAWPRLHGDWRFTPHIQIAMPLPRRGVQGRITGPGFDLSGDAADNGAGKHFGDPSASIGFNVTYDPWQLTLDLGSTIAQALIEPRIHEGVGDNWLLSAHWTF
jgi:hypothetical protein